MTKSKPIVLHITADQPVAVIIVPLSRGFAPSSGPFRVAPRVIATTGETIPGSETLRPLASTNRGAEVIPLFKKVG